MSGISKQSRQHGWVTPQQELAMGGQKGREGGEDGLRGKGWGKEATLKAMGKLGCSPGDHTSRWPHFIASASDLCWLGHCFCHGRPR